MKKLIKYCSKNDLKVFLIFAVLALLTIAFLTHNAFGDVYAYRFIVDENTGYDSVALVIYAVGSTTARDSFMLTSFPLSVAYALDKDSAYNYYIYASWVGNDGFTSSLPEPINIQTPNITVNLSGDGTDTLLIVAYDSLADAVVENVVIDIKNAGGTTVIAKRTNASGEVTATLMDGYTYYIYGYGGGVVWDIDTVSSSAGATDTMWGYTLFTPPAAGDVNWVNVYLDVGTGFIDSSDGSRIPLTNIEFTLTLIGGEGLSDGSWGFIPIDSTVRPSSEGRVLWSVPANTISGMEDSYYELRYKRRGRSSLASGVFKTFIVDTIPDPLNIIDAEIR